jgi:uncharacterized BrkB/YihY/UPF0761 family membrane protein
MLKLLWLLAANPYDVTANEINLPKSTGNVPQILTNVTQLIMGVLGGIAIIAIIYAGITFAYSRGDAKRVQQARETILYAVVGLVVAIAGLAIVTFLADYLGGKK